MPIRIETLCSELQIGRTKLYEIFRKELNIGVSKYILKRRMHRAKKLIKTTELSVTEISQSVGFSDYNYFSKVFKKIYGRSPKSYRIKVYSAESEAADCHGIADEFEDFRRYQFRIGEITDRQMLSTEI